MVAGVNDLLDGFDSEHDSESRQSPGSRKLALAVCGLLLVLTTIVATQLVDRFIDNDADTGDSTTEPPAPTEPERPNWLPLTFGAQDVPVDTVTIPAATTSASLLRFDADIEPTPTSSARAAMVSFRVECRSGQGPAEMQSTGAVSTNVFLAHGGSVSGQALTAETNQEMECTLLAAAPFIEKTDDGLTSLPLHAELRTELSDSIHAPALHRLDDATLFESGTKKNVLSRQIDDPATLRSMSSTVRLTSCTVVGGSRDGDGANKCQESMTGRESSTVRIRVIARWLDAEGNIESTSTYWDETLAIDYNTHHVPWTLHQDGMDDQVPEDASAVVLVVQVESLAGTPVVVHADGTDAVISTQT